MADKSLKYKTGSVSTLGILYIYIFSLYIFLPARFLKNLLLAWKNVVLNTQQNNMVFIGRSNQSVFFLKQKFYMVFVGL